MPTHPLSSRRAAGLLQLAGVLGPMMRRRSRPRRLVLALALALALAPDQADVQPQCVGAITNPDPDPEQAGGAAASGEPTYPAVRLGVRVRATVRVLPQP